MNSLEGRASASVDPALADLVERLTARLQAGEAVDEQAVLAEHPAHAEWLRDLLPALRLVAGLSKSGPEFASALSAGPAGEEALTGTLGDFRLLREAGRGGMGVVYEAEQISLGRRVALKVLPFAATMDPRHLQRFHNEARAAACLHHEHIVPVYFVGCERGVHFYAMQFIDGRTLTAVIHEMRQQAGLAAPAQAVAEVRATPPLPGRAGTAAETSAQAGLSTQRSGRGQDFYRSVAELGVQAALALEHAHQRGIVHRDIKPGNLLLDERGSVWVTDFGLAQLQHGEGNLTLTGDLVGTLRYMSPEQAMGKRVVIDQRSDVYSLGVTLYELLALRPAFSGSDRAELLRQVAFEDPVAPRKLERGIPAELETIVLKAIEKNPADRYPTAQELADDLRRWLEDRPIQARRPSLRQVAVKWARRHRVVVAAAAVCLAVSLAALAGSVGWALGEQRARQRQGEDRVHEALDEAAPGLRRGNPWDPSLTAAVQRATAQRDAGAVGPEMRARVDQLLHDVDMLVRLENARLQPAAGSERMGFDYAGAEQLYAEAFREHGLDVLAPDPQPAVQRIRASAIRLPLVAALDDWAFAWNQLGKGRESPLRAVADLADDDPWRRRMRGALRRWDRGEMVRLAQAKGASSQPPAHRVLLARALDGVENRSAAEQLLRRARAEQPEEFWFNYQLAFTLLHQKSRDLAQVIRFFQAALALRPQSHLVHYNLGAALLARGDPDEAMAECREAIRLKPDFAGAHTSLGVVLVGRGRVDEAIAEHRLALKLWPNYHMAHNNLGHAYQARGQLDEAIAAYRRAIDCKKDFPLAHYNLGIALFARSRVDEAIAAFREAIRLQPEYPEAFNDLGAALRTRGRPDEAIAAYQQAIRLKADFAGAHNNLGIALGDKGRLDEAIAAYREAIRIEPGSAVAHMNLGIALYAKGKLDEAIAAYRAAIRLNKALPEAHFNLGNALLAKGWLDEAITAYRKATHLKKDYTKAQNNLGILLRVKGQLDRLPAVLAGKDQPRNAVERVNFAQVCQRHQQRFATAARFYQEAFVERPALAADPQKGVRYNAACAAALAGCGKGERGHRLPGQERLRWRQQALSGLRADLDAWRGLLDKAPAQVRPVIVKKMQHWQSDPDFAGVRGAQALDNLPEAERQPWQQLWSDVADLRDRASTTTAPQTRPGAK
jgi:serine/threonine protein kinase/tetratricopeptide (TPR) repeat protein